MTLEEDIFQKTKINYDKLISYGFHKQSHQYIYVQDIFDHTMPANPLNAIDMIAAQINAIPFP